MCLPKHAAMKYFITHKKYIPKIMLSFGYLRIRLNCLTTAIVRGKKKFRLKKFSSGQAWSRTSVVG